MTKFGLPYFLGVLITGIALFLIAIFGAEIFRRAQSLMTIAIVVCLIIIFWTGYTSPAVDVVSEAAAMPQSGSIGKALWSGLR